VLGLDAVAQANALGIAASRCGGLLANVGTMTKSTHCGHAAMLGLEAAMLAARGFTGNADVFETHQGYGVVFFGDTFVGEDLLNFGPPFRIVQPGYAMKMFPSQYGTHFGITAGLALHADVPDVELVKAVTLVSPVMQYVNRPFPETGLSGKFSLQYTMGRALLDGRVGIDTFSDEKVREPAIVALLRKVTLRMDPAIPARFDQMHVELRVELTDGRVLHTRCDGPRGIWGSPPITEADHLVKVRDCLGRVLPEAQAEQLIALAREVDALDSDGVREMLRLAGGV
jgi:aconitate decarboxylase